MFETSYVAAGEEGRGEWGGGEGVRVNSSTPIESCTMELKVQASDKLLAVLQHQPYILHVVERKP